LRSQQKEIIGVVEDYHYRGLQYAVEPLVMEIDPAMFHHIGLTVSTENLSETLRFIEDKWHELFPEKPFEYFFLDTYFARRYESETRIGRLLGTFTTMGLFIACLGLLGLASFVTEQRTKEIGIRKVLGASVPGVVFLFTKEFTRWVVIANVIGWPVAYLFMHRWLQSFAYRMPLGLEPFLLSGLSALVIALGTISFQSIKTAMTDPVKSLRTE
jgi:putative ABC transport system permease protein